MMADNTTQDNCEVVPVVDANTLSTLITDYVTTSAVVGDPGQIEMTDVDEHSLSLSTAAVAEFVGGGSDAVPNRMEEEFLIPVGIGSNSESNITKHCYPSDDEASESEDSSKQEDLDMDVETAYQYVMEQQQLIIEKEKVESHEVEGVRVKVEGEPCIANHDNPVVPDKLEGMKTEKDESEGNCEKRENINNESNSVPNEDELKSCRTFKIFVSNLPPGMLNSELADRFLKYGDVVECEIFSKNYAFVHMVSEECGIKALNELNGLEIQGCKINVKKSNQSSGPKIFLKKSADMEVGTYKIYIGHLIENVTKEYVTKMLEPFGRVVEIEIFRQNAAFVHMETEAGAKQAMKELNGKILPELEKPILVTEAKNPEGPSLAVMKLKVKNVATITTAETLRNLFVPYGLVLKVKIFPSKGSTRNAIVHLEQFGNIRSAIKELSGKEVEGSVLHVEPFFEPVNSVPPPAKPINIKQNIKKQSFPPIRPPPPPRSHFGQTYARVPRNLDPHQNGFQIQPRPRMHRPAVGVGSFPPPMGRRLIPMPSEAELGRYPMSERGRVLVRPPPLLNQHGFPPPFRHEEYNGYDHYQQGNFGQNEDCNEYSDDNYFNTDPSFDNNDPSYFSNDTSYDNNEPSYDSNDPSYFNNDTSYDNDDSSYYNNDRSYDNNYKGPPTKIFRNKTGKHPGQKFGSGAQQWNMNNQGSRPSNNNQDGPFPDFPAPEKFPKGRPPSLMSMQVPVSDCDFSSDLPISNFSQFSSPQDFTADETLPTTSTMSAVPFDYTQMGRKLGNNIPKGVDSRLKKPNSQVYYNQDGIMKVRGNRGGKNAKAKGKPRRPGLGSFQQQKKTANQSGNSEPLGALPSLMHSIIQPEQVCSSSASTAPSYFQQSWPNAGTKKFGRKPNTWKEMKDSEEEQKRQYSDYLKQKPWLYQAIPGTVKRVDK
ncbi:unnamed protein product [Orchesella dallaii]|uniref:RRM domain-containing protein n=1 Tax=Orchesella dallaii TaxID=48710 RepID=A0ABP1R2F8_9HEXA